MTGLTRASAIELSEAGALEADRRDPLAHTRAVFSMPEGDPVYLCGNSLGLMPKAVRSAVDAELDDWAKMGVEGHFKSRDNWYRYHEHVRDMGARLVGASAHEVVFMNSLTVNLHLMFVSFYRPKGSRTKILIDWPIFPSDIYAAKSQLRAHGVDASDLLIARPREGEQTLRTDDLVELIDRHKNELALVHLAGVNFATGQLMDIEAITSACRERNIPIGWDLAHAAGNVPLALHDWGPDFACWCTYKYLNSGPGAVAGCFIHERHHARADPADLAAMPRYEGWWGNDPKQRFAMGPDFVPIASADAWQLSNPPILSFVPVKVSLEIFDRVGMEALRAKSLELTGFLEALVDNLSRDRFRIITPRDPMQRGCQLSITIADADARQTFEAIKAKGLIGDFRQPNIIRLAPAPLYNSFHDCWRAAEILSSLER